MALSAKTISFLQGSCVRNVNSVYKMAFRSIVSIEQHGSYLRLKDDESRSRPVELSYFWLRDQCRCNQCYDHTTYQRLKHITEYPMDITPVSVTLSETYGDLHITWRDHHSSLFSGDWVKRVLQPANKPTYSRSDIVPWSGEELQSRGIPTISFQDIEKHKNAYAPSALYDNVLKYGICRISNAPTDVKAIKKVAAKIALEEDSFYGLWWKLSNDVEVLTDVGYDNVPLFVHTDCTYFQQPPGYMFMYGERKAETGGESLFVDGMKAAFDLRSESPWLFNVLKRFSIPHEYIGYNLHFKAYKRTFEMEPDDFTISQICFNPYDRAEMPTFGSVEDQREFFEAYQEFGRLLHRPSAFYQILNEPGTIIVFDNYRILHGRKGFTGRRILGGCYMSRDDFLARARQIQCV